MSDNHEFNDWDNEPLPEGEESPPPYIRTMAIIRWIILGGLTVFALVMVLSYFGLTPGMADDTKAVQYHCPMHPTYISNQPGECPICGMNLVPIDQDSTAVGGSTASDKPMPRKTEIKAGIVQYTCPMHPEIISDAPGKCPICGMNLVPIEQTEPTRDEPQMDMAETESSVPGLVPVTIEPERLQLINVRTAIAARRDVGDKLRAAGYVSPDETRLTNVHTRISGWISRLYADQTGKFIKKGEPLFAIYSQDLYQAEQEYLNALSVIEQKGNDPNLIGLQNRIVNAIKIRLVNMGLSDDDIKQIADEKKSNTDIILRSPVSGYIIEKNVASGQFVDPGQNLFTISDLGHIWVLADIYETDLAGIKIGQEAELNSDAISSPIHGKVAYIYPTLSEKTRTVQIRLEFDNPSLNLRPGMYVNVDIDGAENDALVVPADAVLDGGEKQYLFVVHDKIHFEPRLVKIGRTFDDYIEILSGLSEGEEVLSSANFLIDSESRLKAALSGMSGTPGETPTGHQH
jgi:multidrug efflux pump subunit AcrA (membrane-fusion protein)